MRVEIFSYYFLSPLILTCRNKSEEEETMWRRRRRSKKKINNLSPFSIQLLSYFWRRNGKIYFSSLSKIITTLRYYREELTRRYKACKNERYFDCQVMRHEYHQYSLHKVLIFIPSMSLHALLLPFIFFFFIIRLCWLVDWSSFGWNIEICCTSD